MIYKCKVYLKNSEKMYIELNEKQFSKLKKDVVKKNYDGSLKMRNGDIVTIIK